jgi:hypothetical protein
MKQPVFDCTNGTISRDTEKPVFYRTEKGIYKPLQALFIGSIAPTEVSELEERLFNRTVRYSTCWLYETPGLSPTFIEGNHAVAIPLAQYIDSIRSNTTQRPDEVYGVLNVRTGGIISKVHERVNMQDLLREYRSVAIAA